MTPFYESIEWLSENYGSIHSLPRLSKCNFFYTNIIFDKKVLPQKVQNLGNTNFATKQRYWQNTIGYTQNQQNTIKRPLIIYQKYVKTYIALYFPDLNPKIIPNCENKKNLPCLEICTQNRFVLFLTFWNSGHSSSTTGKAMGYSTKPSVLPLLID